jgi:hypothetical protein
MSAEIPQKIKKILAGVPEKFANSGGYGIVSLWMKEEIDALYDANITEKKRARIIAYISEMLRAIGKHDIKLESYVKLDAKTIAEAKHRAEKTWKRMHAYWNMVDSFGGRPGTYCM